MNDFIELGNIGFLVDVPKELTKLKSDNKTLKFALIGFGFGLIVLAVFAKININKYKKFIPIIKQNEPIIK
ncbi:MAG: hypothetical protein A2046_12305 [Bacteroidetes bacterium GWA2_30_7]|nr:MAG: hypothetical protein A2046_12305 [Bacteroidetes bacterium GWA2_30_7]